jgi:hypothetical protein
MTPLLVSRGMMSAGASRKEGTGAMQTVTLENVLDKVRELPPEKLESVYDYVSYLVDRPDSNDEGQPSVGLTELGMEDYHAELEAYEEKLARGEVQW